MKVSMNDDARKGIEKGIDILADAVEVTMGPKGRNVVIDNKGTDDPDVTKDGVTVAEAIFSEDQLENTGINLVKKAASRTNVLAGDGTTTATVLARALIKEGLRLIASGANPIDIKRGIDKAVADIVAELEVMQIPVKPGDDLLKNIASISANNDPEMGEMIAEAFGKVGESGVVAIKQSRGRDSSVDVVKGMQFDRGYLSPIFPNNKAGTICELHNPMFVICDGKINRPEDITPAMELAHTLDRPLVVIADDVNDGALGTMLVNVHKTVKCVAIKAPGFTDTRLDLLTDIAVLTKSVVFGPKSGFKLEDIKDPIMLGGCETIKVEKGSTTIVNGDGEETHIQTRVNKLITEFDAAKTEAEKKYINTRIAKLNGGVAVVHIGGITPTEAGERKDRADDALCATRAAIEEGIIIGGGCALLVAREKIKQLPDDEQLGARAVYKAVTSPIIAIVENAGETGAVIINEVLKGAKGSGYDAKTGQYVDMMKAGIVDPKMVTRIALENAASIAGMVLLTECAINN